MVNDNDEDNENWEEIKKTKDALEEYLSFHPELKEYQELINSKLNAADDPNERMGIIMDMVMENQNKLFETMQDIEKYIK